MAAAWRTSSIHDKSEKNRNTWAPVNLNPTGTDFPRFGKHTSAQTASAMAGKPRPGQQQEEAPPHWMRSLVPPSEYQPLEVFSSKVDGRSPAPWSEEDEICELCIRLKEFQLTEMMEEEPDVEERTFLRDIRTYKIKPRRKKYT